MARPIKQGLDYFPLDVGFLHDVKIRRIMRACGIQSIPVLISLLANIYRNEGYFLRWSNDMSFLIADELGVSEGAVTATVDKAVQVDFFNANMYEKYGVLTSEGIQSRFFEAVSRRKEVRYDARFLLLNVNVYNNSVNVYNNSVNVYNNQQSKVKESKVKNKQQLYINLNMEEAIKVYQDNIHPITSSIEKEKLIDLIETHGTEHVQQAIEEAVMHNARNLKYVAAVLEAWQEKGYQLASKQNPKSITSDDSEKSQSYIEFMERRKAHKAAQKGGQMGHADRRSDELHQGSARGDIRDTNTADGPREIKKILEDI